MIIKTLVSNYLKSIGVAAKRSELGLNFTYDGWNFLLWNDKEDPMFFRLILPGVFDVTDDNYAEALMACNNVNWNYKVVKAVLYDYEDKDERGASVWMCYEQQLDGTPQVEELIPRAVHSLIAAAEAFTKEMNDD
jgi:hypothetical protein